MGQREIAIRREAATPDLKIAKEGGLLFERIFKTDPGVTIVSSSPKIFSAIHPDDFTENFYLSEVELKSYIKGFVKAVKEFGKETAEKTVKNSSEILEDTALDDKDVKLSLYRSFKSLYDKWISSSNKGNETKGYFFNDYGQADDRFLFDHFNFINRTGSPIGGLAAIDPAYLSTLANSDNGQGGPTQSLYQVVTGLLSENNFDFFALPGYIPYGSNETSEEDLKDMFRAFDGPLSIPPSKPSFLCVYVGGNSRTLDIPRSSCSNKNLIDFDYKDDSFDIGEKEDWPEDFVQSGGVTAFKVRYGQEAQNHFISLQLDQTEFKETQESLQVIDALVNPRQGNSPATAGKGNNIYDMYLTRQYSCTIESLGNLMIQPLMYFKLENVPMFRGTYLIKNIKHTVTPHNVKTEFTGTRQPKIKVPIVKDPISLLDLALSNESVEGPPGSLGGGLLDSGNFSNSGKLTIQPCELITAAGNVLDSSGLGGDFSGLKSFKDLIGQLESGNKYDIANTPKKISTTSIIDKTYDQLVPFQGLPSTNQSRVFAAGRYQVVPDTMKGIVGKNKWTYNFGPGKSGKYDKTIQEKFGEYLILESSSSLGNYIKGKNAGSLSDLEKAIQSASQIWASLPTIKDKHGNVVGSVSTPTANRAYYADTPPNQDYTKVAIGTLANTLIKTRIDYSSKRPEYITDSYNNGAPTKCEGGITNSSGGNMGCSRGFVPFGIPGVTTDITSAKNIIVGSSSVGTLNSVNDSNYGGFKSNQIYVYYNCAGEALTWVKGKVTSDTNVYKSVESYFQAGIGTNDGYKVSDSIGKNIKGYTDNLKKKFPNATLYVLPGTRGWGNLSDKSLADMKKYYKQYTDYGWTLLWPKNNSSQEIDPYFTTSEAAHSSSSEWFKKQMKLIKENKA